MKLLYELLAFCAIATAIGAVAAISILCLWLATGDEADLWEESE